MSYYADYVKENSHDEIIETEYGFATYRYLNHNRVYIVDIYVSPERRKIGAAGAIADMIAAIAKEKGCTEMIGSIVATSKTATTSLRVLLGYGMILHGIEGNMILFIKAI